MLKLRRPPKVTIGARIFVWAIFLWACFSSCATIFLGWQATHSACYDPKHHAIESAAGKAVGAMQMLNEMRKKE